MNPSDTQSLPIETSFTLHDANPLCPPPRVRVSATSIVGRIMLAGRVIRDIVLLLLECFYDFMRMLKHSSAVFTGNSREKLSALITMAYHGIEKGLALPAPRPGFGKDAVNTLIARLEWYGRTFGFDENAVTAYRVLLKYYEHSVAHGCRDDALESRINTLSRHCPSNSPGHCGGGVRGETRNKFLEAAQIDLRAFFSSRASVRQYASTKVDLALVHAALDMARRTPSCCNRQSGRVWVLQDANDVQEALLIQGGARGFKDEVPMVLVVTADLACFQSSGERYQAWIDGGMFAMSVVYALHSLGLVSCCLNWSKSYQTDAQFRKRFEIPESENIIMFLSVGHPKDEYVVAQSCRREVSELTKLLKRKGTA